MKKNVLFFAIAMLAMGTAAQAQTDEKKKVEFKPIATTMMSVYGEFPEGGTKYGFNLDRTYVGVEGKLGDEWSFKSVVDCGRSSKVDDYERLMYIKNAYFQWKRGGIAVRGGLISTNIFNAQEKFWGRRYVMKSFQDEYKFGSSADLGVAVDWSPSSVVSLDAIIVNGEGYKKIQQEKGLLYGIGMTLKPIDGLMVRLYADINQRPDGGKPQKNCNIMVGYKTTSWSLAAEGNWLFTRDDSNAKHQSGTSVYGSAKAGKCDIFARYDFLTSRADWNKAKDGHMALLGVEFAPCRYLKIAPNARLWKSAAGGRATFYANVNLQFAL